MKLFCHLFILACLVAVLYRWAELLCECAL